MSKFILFVLFIAGGFLAWKAGATAAAGDPAAYWQNLKPAEFFGGASLLSFIALVASTKGGKSKSKAKSSH